MKFLDGNFKVSKSGHNYAVDYNDHIKGVIVTPYGIVSVYAHGDTMNSNMTSIAFVWRGRHHHRMWSKRYSLRHIKTLAMRFAKEVVEKERKDHQ